MEFGVRVLQADKLRTAAHSKQDQGTKATIQQTARFEGQSTMHHDFQAPPPVALNQAQSAAATTEVSPIRFEGESSMKAHYQAPSEEALIAATGGIRQQQPDIKVEETKVALEGQSTTRHITKHPFGEAASLLRATNLWWHGSANSFWGKIIHEGSLCGSFNGGSASCKQRKSETCRLTACKPAGSSLWGSVQCTRISNNMRRARAKP